MAMFNVYLELETGWRAFFLVHSDDLFHGRHLLLPELDSWCVKSVSVCVRV